MVLEICVENYESAINAFKGGADRLEICSSLCLGGLTPSVGFVRVLKQAIPNCKMFVMIRPKPGEDYIYNDNEVDIMIQDIEVFKQNGADGFVFGCLDKSRKVDESACKKLLKAAANYPCTFHRAFDVVQNPEDALMTIINLGFSRILTSGQDKTALLGKNLIKSLIMKVEALNSNLKIVAGGGINEDNVEEILRTTGVKEYHGSARTQTSESCTIYITNEFVVKKMAEIGKKLLD